MVPASANASKIAIECKNGTHQCLHPQKESNRFLPSDRYLKISKCIFFMYGLGTSKTAVFVLGPCVSGSAFTKPFKCECPSPTALWFFCI